MVVVALLVAGLATAGRVGVFQSGTQDSAGRLDPQRIAPPGGGQPLPSGICPPTSEPAGAAGSDLTFAGACAFHQAAAAYCRTAPDDFYAFLRRAMGAGATLDLYVNVEFYKGPGTYRRTQALMVVQDGPTLYQWSNYDVTATVARDGRSVTLPPTELLTQPGQAGAGPERLQGSIGCGGQPAGG